MGMYAKSVLQAKSTKHDKKVWTCQLGDKEVLVERAADDVEVGSEAVLMARPESLRVVESGAGKIEGKVRMNVYLGHSLEAFINTSFGEVLVQIDDPHAKKVFKEGEAVSIDFTPDRVRLLNKNDA